MSSRLTQLSRSVAGRTAIVTGSASGMGRATAHLFADEGANVVVADLGEERVAAVVDEIAAAHGADRVLGQVTDVADPAALRALVDATVGRFGGLDIVVNNAGISGVSSMFLPEDEFEDVWSRTLAVNLTAYARLVRLALPHLLESDGARIVNIASTEAIVATGGLPAYSATKAGVTGLTRNLAVELGRHGITANCICPGPINTGMTSSIDDSAKEIYAKRRVPLRRWRSRGGRPDDAEPAPPGGVVPQRGDHPGGRRDDGAPHLNHRDRTSDEPGPADATAVPSG
ncbi:MAG: SDR family NAD(P)-dependent oxidoreductase [Ilumatobacteraceae bacterium]